MNDLEMHLQELKIYIQYNLEPNCKGREDEILEAVELQFSEIAIKLEKLNSLKSLFK